MASGCPRSIRPRTTSRIPVARLQHFSWGIYHHVAVQTSLFAIQPALVFNHYYLRIRMDLIPAGPSSVAPDEYDKDDPMQNPYPSQSGGGSRNEGVDPANLTPTRLRTSLKASGYDQGLIRRAGSRRAALQPQVATSTIPARSRSQEPLFSDDSPEPPALQPHFVRPPPPFILPDVSGDSQQDLPPEAMSDISRHDDDTARVPQESTFCLPQGSGDLFDPSYLPPPSLADEGRCLPIPAGSWEDAEALAALAQAPVTNLIPPTPAPAKSGTSPTTTPGRSPPGKSSSATGRLSEENKAILQNHFKMIEEIILEASTDTSLPPQQVLSLWRRQSTRTNQNLNVWNAYQKYFFANIKTEIARLDHSPSQPYTIAHVRLCYPLFQAANKNWKEMLAVWHEAHLLTATDETIQQRRSLFEKCFEKICKTADSTASQHGFGWVIVAVGSSIHQDASLAQIHCTADATDFFDARLGVTNDLVTGQLKAHVYNNISLGLVPETRETIIAATATKQVIEVHDDSPENPLVPDEDEDRVGGDDDDDVDAIAFIRSEIPLRFKAVGGNFGDKLLPWKKMSKVLGDRGFILHNWPDEGPLPGHSTGHSLKKKGVTDLTKVQQQRLVMAIKSTQYPIHFTKGTAAEKKDLRLSVAPVIICAPPACNSHFPRSQRMFADGHTDRLGLPKLLPSTAQTVVTATKKEKPKPTANIPGKEVSDEEQSIYTVHDSESTPSSPDPLPQPKRLTRASVKVLVPPRRKNDRVTRVVSDSDVEMGPLTLGSDEETVDRAPMKRGQDGQGKEQVKRVKFTPSEVGNDDDDDDDDDGDDDDRALASMLQRCKSNKKAVKGKGKGKETASMPPPEGTDRGLPNVARPEPKAAYKKSSAVAAVLFPENSAAGSATTVSPPAPPTTLILPAGNNSIPSSAQGDKSSAVAAVLFPESSAADGATTVSSSAPPTVPTLPAGKSSAADGATTVSSSAPPTVPTLPAGNNGAPSGIQAPSIGLPLPTGGDMSQAASIAPHPPVGPVHAESRASSVVPSLPAGAAPPPPLPLHSRPAQTLQEALPRSRTWYGGPEVHHPVRGYDVYWDGRPPPAEAERYQDDRRAASGPTRPSRYDEYHDDDYRHGYGYQPQGPHYPPMMVRRAYHDGPSRDQGGFYGQGYPEGYYKSGYPMPAAPPSPRSSRSHPTQSGDPPTGPPAASHSAGENAGV